MLVEITNKWNKNEFGYIYRISKQIVSLVNRNNQLNSVYRPENVMGRNYYIVNVNGTVLACVEVDKQSYSFTEIRHLCVESYFRNYGIGKLLVERAIKHVKTPMIYATVLKNNIASCKLFNSLSFKGEQTYINKQGKEVLLLVMRNSEFQNRKEV